MSTKLKQEFKKAFSKRSKDSHKGDYGHLFLVSGSVGMTGAAALAAKAALRSGAGLVTLGIPASLNSVLEAKVTEAMTFPIEDGKKGYLSHQGFSKVSRFIKDKDIVGIGPGLGRRQETFSFVRKLTAQVKKPIVLDADGLIAFKGHLNAFKKKDQDIVITPHPGEFDHVFGTNVKQQKSKRKSEAIAVAKRYHLIVVLKGHQTVVASPAGKVFINTTGNPGMATGGTGDVLFGILTAFLGLGLASYQAACFAVYLHGLAGDLATKVISENSLIASDIIDFLPVTFQKLLK